MIKETKGRDKECVRELKRERVWDGKREGRREVGRDRKRLMDSH